jgi:hypothetical protein
MSKTQELILGDYAQIVISPRLKQGPNIFAFKEEGVAMLSCLLGRN